MRDRVLRTIALLGREVGEADRLVVLLSREEGKIVASAKSSRKPGSRLAPLVEPFVLADCRVIQGRSEIQRLAGGEVVDPFRGIRKDIDRVARASLMAEVADQGTEPGQATPLLFALLQDCLRHLSAGAPGPDVELYYLLHVTHLLGYGVSLRHCAVCGGHLSESGLAFAPAEGGLLCSDCIPNTPGRRVDPTSLSTMLALQRAKLGEALATPLPDPSRRAWLDGLRAHVRYHMGVPLRSADVLRSLEQGEVSPQ